MKDMAGGGSGWQAYKDFVDENLSSNVNEAYDRLLKYNAGIAPWRIDNVSWTWIPLGRGSSGYWRPQVFRSTQGFLDRNRDGVDDNVQRLRRKRYRHRRRYFLHPY